VRIDAKLLPVLRTQFGRQCEVDGTPDDRSVRARLAAPTALMIDQHLARWGAVVEVVEPESAWAELARIGSEPAGRYTT